MYYKNSVEIFTKIKSAKKILINCHNNPDADSVGSALSLYQVIKKFNIDVDVVCPTEKLPNFLNYLKGHNEVINGFNYDNYDKNDYDLTIILDSANKRVVTGNKDTTFPSGVNNLILIDHHEENKLDFNEGILDINASSVTEILYKLYTDNLIEIDADIATMLLTGIFGDTAILTLPSATKETYDVVNKLVQIGAQKDLIIMNLTKSENLKMYKFWKMCLDKIQVDVENKFTYVFVSNDEFKEFADLESAKPKFASLFSNGLIDTDFGVIGIETKYNLLNVSIRARTNYDTTVIAKNLGGGGHKAMSATIIDNLNFDEAVQKVLEVCRKYANKIN